MSRTFLLVAGEPSGDRHGAALMRELNARNAGTQYIGLGGNEMMLEGLRPLHHVKRLAVTGFVEVVKHLPFFRRVMRDVLEASERYRPAAAILIDYPGFNLRLGKKLNALGIPVYYYISPQVWAWKKGRVKDMKRFIKRMFVIFPFEEQFYRDEGIPATFVGHPLLETDFKLSDRDQYLSRCGLDPARPVVALLPGSRNNEILRHEGPVMKAVEAVLRERPRVQFLLGALSSVPSEYYDEFRKHPAITIRYDEAFEIMKHADLAVVSSGTATLETAFLGTPMVVIYRMAYLSYLLGRLFVKIDHIAMPNLIMDERVVPELIQGQVEGESIASWIINLLEDERLIGRTRMRLEEVKHRLGQPGAAQRVVQQITLDLKGLDGG